VNAENVFGLDFEKGEMTPAVLYMITQESRFKIEIKSRSTGLCAGEVTCRITDTNSTYRKINLLP
jgi:hypothetical protein